MNKTIAIIIAVIVVIAGIFFFTRGSSAPSLPAQTSAQSEGMNPGGLDQPAASSTGSIASTTATYTLADVAKHKDATSCWSAINGSVYDLTNWIGEHPGGPQRILSICGTDGSTAFNGQHGNDPDPRPREMLATMKIGTLTE